MQFVHEYLSQHGKTATPYHRTKKRYTFEYVAPTGEALDIMFQVLNESGNLSSATLAEMEISEHHPHYCFLLGIAGSMSPVARLGDVVVCTGVKSMMPDAVKEEVKGEVEFAADAASAGVKKGVKYLDPRKKILTKSYLRYKWRSIQREGSVFSADAYCSWLKKLAQPPELLPIAIADIPDLEPAYENLTPTVHRGTVYGSDMVVDSGEYVAFVQDRDANPEGGLYHMGPADEAKERHSWFTAPLLAVDMETLGFFQMAEARFGPAKVPQFYSIRGISDFSERKSRLDTKSNQLVRQNATLNALKIALNMVTYLERLRLKN